MTLGWALLLGVALGLRHAVDVDHVAVIATLLDRQPSWRAGARLAALWGLGHALTFLAAGLAIVVLGVQFPPTLDRAAELAVAAMLVLLGLLHLRRLRAARAPHATPTNVTWRPVVIGLVHGLAGSAGIALVALATIPTTRTAVAYLVVFAAGTLVGMVVVTALVSRPLAVVMRGRARKALIVGASLANVALGTAVGIAAATSG